jgi:hypothetical protein
MQNAKTLTTRQLAVIDDLFMAELTEQHIFEKHKINKQTYDKWLADKNFVREFDRRLDSAKRQNDLIIARYAANAVAKLIQLTDSKSQETARKACLDIIGLLRPVEKQPDSGSNDTAAESPAELPPELAGKLLAVIAENGEKKQVTKVCA